MSLPRDELIDFLLGELPPERAAAVEGDVARDPEKATYLEAMDLIRTVADEGWERPSPRARLRWLKPALAAAAILLVAVAVYWMNGAVSQGAVFEPDGAHGYLLPEEVDTLGRVRRPSAAGTVTVASGHLKVRPLGSDQWFDLKAGATVAFDTTVRTLSEGSARVDLPDGGIVFLAPLSEARVARHQRGGIALRLLDGTAGVVAGDRAVHLAVDETDLLLALRGGATLLRKSPSEAIALRGELDLLLAQGKRFRVPVGERLPAACANSPQTSPAAHEELNLDWYFDLVYGDAGWRSDAIGPTAEVADVSARTLLYLDVLPASNGTLEIAFGGAPRVFPIRQGVALQLRLRLRALGPGPHLEITPKDAIRTARLFEAD